MRRFNPLDRGNSNQIASQDQGAYDDGGVYGFNPLDRGNSNQIGPSAGGKDTTANRLIDVSIP